ncbi:glutamate--cysteine ligase catalytic subunit-like isoform X3 [Xenia sp. Carnegie-2017]|uniref:glutamate--cysteine ligase catalytic subunit-like isoform X3 n=1 Tax=Xenia sp. Carnegie-2017 TaxID=2897299 RepID=UPI001F04BCE0|nr:glutamate--cysteine ligase catalytic subunit-like isoform X3 [Xenia sp. Carnegie-2017]
MGLLTEGSPLSWEETKKYANHIRSHGITQLLNIFKRLQHRENDCLKWGDEVEYVVVKFDHAKKKAKLLLKGQDLLPKLQEEEHNNPGKNETSWKPEYASYMLEGTPGQPLGGCMRHFNMIEANMKLRRQEVMNLLNPEDECLLSMTCFPRIGCPQFTFPCEVPTPTSGASNSLFFPDQAINRHPRFSTLTRNIRERRGRKVAINVPIFKDVRTPSPFIEKFPIVEGEGAAAALPDHIYLDAMGFGMGCCCLQMTFQACNIDEARHLYDQLTVLTPIIHALSAAAPIFRGYLADVDCRWNVISAAVDDRTEEEQGLVPLKNDRFRIRKSRYDSIDSYLSVAATPYSDIDLVYDEEIFQRLLNEGMDEPMAKHFAHLYIRDPLTLFSEKIHLNDEKDSDHFENIQSTNWQTMRFKPPPANSPIGWRVEFRPTEVQLTDFENAAFATFVVLITRVIISFNLNLLIPFPRLTRI